MKHLAQVPELISGGWDFSPGGRSPWPMCGAGSPSSPSQDEDSQPLHLCASLGPSPLREGGMGACSLLGVWFLRALSRCLHGPLTAPLAGGGAAPPSRSPAELLLAHTSPGPGSVAPVPASSFRETLSGTSWHICVARRVSIQPYQMLLKMCGPGERPRHEEGSSPYLLGPS